MPWIHTCKLPGKFLIKLKRARPGATYACTCGKIYELGLRGHSDSGLITYRWTLEEDSGNNVSNTERGPATTGFQANSS